MLPDFSDTRIIVAHIGFCWQLTGSAVARLLGILINSFGGGGHALFYIDLLCFVISRNICAVLNRNSLYLN